MLVLGPVTVLGQVTVIGPDFQKLLDMRSQVLGFEEVELEIDINNVRNSPSSTSITDCRSPISIESSNSLVKLVLTTRSSGRTNRTSKLTGRDHWRSSQEDIRRRSFEEEIRGDAQKRNSEEKLSGLEDQRRGSGEGVRGGVERRG
ncbi:hypothetical protein M758_10G182500 [Ceratodon purpureus]|nr:hypothetical protein M758_10G182500 [Ceratodon purpureus]